MLFLPCFFVCKSNFSGTMDDWWGGAVYHFCSITSSIDDFICNGASIGLNSAPIRRAGPFRAAWLLQGGVRLQGNSR